RFRGGMLNSLPPDRESQMLSFGVTVLPDPPYTRLVEVLQQGERLGFEYGWTYDSHILWQESYALLAIAGTQTQSIKLGHCVTNPGIRDPTITASWYATMQDVTNGRMAMGIGRGDSSRRVVGLKPVNLPTCNCADHDFSFDSARSNADALGHILLNNCTGRCANAASRF